MSAGEGPPDPRSGPLAAVRWFLSTDHEGVVFVRELLSSAAAVAAVGLLLFAVSGVWPPMVAVQSGSMEPHMTRGDLVFVMDEQRLAPEEAQAGTGVVTYAAAEGSEYTKFGEPGDVVIYRPDGSANRVPIIHRARFWVEEDENWYDEADESYVPDQYDDCEELPDCPAPHAGFITRGDANDYYDQGRGISGVVKPEWIRGTGEFRIPWLGHVRLAFSELLAVTGPVAPVGAGGSAVAG